MKKAGIFFLTIAMACILVACNDARMPDDAVETGANWVSEDQTEDQIYDSKEVMVITADYPVYDSAKELIDTADIIFSGSVVDSKCEYLDVKSEKGKDSSTGLEEASPVPYTIYSIKIEKMYKGESQEDVIKIKCPGGIIDGIEYASEITEQIKVGGQYLFLAKTYENSYPSLLNDTQAVYDLGNLEEKGVRELLDALEQ